MTIYQTTFIICLFSSHILGDFLLQPKSIALNKKKIWVQILHSVILAAVGYLLCGVWNNWLIPLAIFISHFIVDYAKTQLKTYLNKKNEINKPEKTRSKVNDPTLDPAWVFILDQFLHFLILAILAVYFFPLFSHNFYWVSIWGNQFLGILILLSGFVLTVFCNSYLIGFIMHSFPLDRTTDQGFSNGGKVIGLLERAIIFLLLLIGEPGGIGFLIAAKTLFRFGEIQKKNNRKEVEYILIGTLLSFAMAIAVTVITLLLSMKVGGVQYKIFQKS
jgi:hypothetical protein